MRRKWWLLVVLVVVVGLAIGGAVILRRNSASPQAQPVPGEETAVVERGTLQVTIGGSGSLVPEDEVSLSFQVGGRVQEVLVEVGTAVPAGAVLVRLDDADAREAVAEAELALSQARLDLALAQAEADAGLAQANLEAAQSAHEDASALAARTGDRLTSVRVNLQQARDNLAEAQENYDQTWDQARDWELDVAYRRRPLEAEREATEKALSNAQYNLQVAQAAYNLEAASIGAQAVTNAQAQVVSAQVSAESQPLRLEQLRLAVSQVELRLASAQRALAETELMAPMAGTITTLNAIEGELAVGGQPAVVLSDLTQWVIDVSLDETDVTQVRVGQAVLVTLDALSGAGLSGEIADIAPLAYSQSGIVLYPVTVRLAPTELPIRGGMTADVEIVAASQDDVLIVPLRAVRSDEDGQTYVLRQTASGGFEVAPVTLGMTTDVEVEITSGLAEGDVVSVVAMSGAAGGSLADPLMAPFNIMRGGNSRD